MNDVQAIVKETGDKVKLGETTWQLAAMEFNKQTGMDISGEALRKRYGNLKDNDMNMSGEKTNEEYEAHFQNGSIEVQKEIFFDENEEKTPETILKKFGYSPLRWTLVEWRIGKWEVAIKDEASNRVCTTIRAKIKPKVNDLNAQDTLEIAKELFKDKIPTTLELEPKGNDKELDKNKMFAFILADLHLGAYTSPIDTGFEYNTEIAKSIFLDLIKGIIAEQQLKKVGKLVYTIGNDFLNFDNYAGTTTKGTPQQNSGVMKEIYKLGLELQIQALITLREYFNEIEVVLDEGNHDKSNDYTIFLTIENLFRNDNVVKVRSNYRPTQCVVFGKTCLFLAHGESNYKRFMASLSSEFAKEYGNTKHRYALLCHLHSEQSIIEQNGITMYRLSTVFPGNNWEYESRYIGAQRKQQLFEFDKDSGMLSVTHLTVNDKGKVKVRK